MRLQLPTTTGKQVLLAASAALVHAIATVVVSDLAAPWGADAYIAATWALTMMPGVLITIGLRRARRHWWRWPLTWVLLLITFPVVAQPVMVVGHAWAGVAVLKEPSAAG
ncbi:hypothetical protein [Pseudactinotalea sp. Z1748]|uniref:hypothetical protein n=1 Tax=Pseudactinotalea sp. Z1748 TaxID=3413027 RepID=UPI003C7DEA78